LDGRAVPLRIGVIDEPLRHRVAEQRSIAVASSQDRRRRLTIRRTGLSRCPSSKVRQAANSLSAASRPCFDSAGRFAPLNTTKVGRSSRIRYEVATQPRLNLTRSGPIPGICWVKARTGKVSSMYSQIAEDSDKAKSIVNQRWNSAGNRSLGEFWTFVRLGG